MHWGGGGAVAFWDPNTQDEKQQNYIVSDVYQNRVNSMRGENFAKY